MGDELLFADKEGDFYLINYNKPVPYNISAPIFPSPTDYATKNELITSIQKWKTVTKEAVDNILLPLPVSLFCYIPAKPFQNNIINRVYNINNLLPLSCYNQRYFDYKKNLPLPATSVELFDALLDNSEKGSDLGSIVLHGKEKKQIPTEYYIQKERKWGAELVPREPDPELFNTYEEYRDSLKRWSMISSVKCSHPSDFSNSIGVPINDNNNLNIINDSNKKNKNDNGNNNSNNNCNNTNSNNTANNNNNNKKETLCSNKGISNKEDEKNKVNKENKYVPDRNLEPKRIFDGTDFLKLKEVKMPMTHLLNKLYKQVVKNQENCFQQQKSESETSKRRKSLPILPTGLSIQLPFKKKELINKLDDVCDCTNESIKLANTFRFYRFVCDPFIDFNFVSFINPNLATLSTDFSSIQMEKLLLELPPQNYDSFMAKLPFFLKQLHIVKSNRIRSRFYVILCHLFKNKPRSISNFFADPLTLSNVASLISDFAFLDIPIQIYAPSENISPKIRDLTLFLFANQLTNVLSEYAKKFQPDNNPLAQQIQAQTMMFNHFSVTSLNDNLKEIEHAFFDPKPIHCVIFHFLCDYNSAALPKLFNEIPFYIFLGKVANSPDCHKYYGSLCGHILRTESLRHSFFELFFHNPCKTASKSTLDYILPTCSFLAELIDSESESVSSITADEILSTMLNVAQLVQLDPSMAILLVRSIVNFFMKFRCNCSNNNLSEYNAIFGNIREYLQTLFKSPSLQVRHYVQLYEIMKMVFIPCRQDSQKSFKTYVIDIVMKNMKSKNIKLAIVSWTAFRELMLDPGAQFLKDSNTVKKKLKDIVSKKLPSAIQIQILLLEIGFVNNNYSSIGEQAKKKRSRKSFSNYEQKDGYIIVGINPRILFDQIIEKFTNGQLTEYSNEIRTLKVLMPSFKWKKRTTSNYG